MIVPLLVCGCGGGSDSSISPNNNDIVIDMSGVWEGSMTPQKRNEEQIRLELTKNGPNISGEMTFANANHQSDDVTGSVEDSTVTISAIFPSNNGGEFELAYEGPVAGNTFSETFT